MDNVKNYFDIIFHLEERTDGQYRATCWQRQQCDMSGWHPSKWAAIAEIVDELAAEDKQDRQYEADQTGLEQWRQTVTRTGT